MHSSKKHPSMNTLSVCLCQLSHCGTLWLWAAFPAFYTGAAFYTKERAAAHWKSYGGRGAALRWRNVDERRIVGGRVCLREGASMFLWVHFWALKSPIFRVSQNCPFCHQDNVSVRHAHFPQERVCWESKGPRKPERASKLGVGFWAVGVVGRKVEKLLLSFFAQISEENLNKILSKKARQNSIRDI